MILVKYPDDPKTYQINVSVDGCNYTAASNIEKVINQVGFDIVGMAVKVFNTIDRRHRYARIGGAVARKLSVRFVPME